MTFHSEKVLFAAQGYFELGMMEDALEELGHLPPALRSRLDVLQMRLCACMRVHRWEDALRASEKLCELQPQEGMGYIHAAFCLHELGRTPEARDRLLGGPAALLREATYHYNLGCYDAALGDIESAQNHLQASFRLDRKFREYAKTDPDLKSVWATL